MPSRRHARPAATGSRSSTRSPSRARSWRTRSTLDSDALIAEVKKLRGKKKPLSLAALRSLREEHERTIVPAQALAREAIGLEQQVSDLVNAAYGLTPAEVGAHVGDRPAPDADTGSGIIAASTPLTLSITSRHSPRNLHMHLEIFF